MEIANLWRSAGSAVEGVRLASREDAGGITRLLREAPASHLHADWHYPIDWLGLPGFVVLEQPGDRPAKSRLFGSDRPLRACLAVAADPPPAAWVRVAALAPAADPIATLATQLAAVAPYLQEIGATQLAWLPIDDWPAAWFHTLGFEQVNEIITLLKEDMSVPRLDVSSDLHIRPVQSEDLQELEAIEAESFGPLWRHSQSGLRLARRQSMSFDVAELDGEIAGFQFSTRSQQGAHLARMTVKPGYQRAGVGSALLLHAIDGYVWQGIRRISLNTQADNWASRNLYGRFGFETSEQRFPVWSADLSA